MKRTFSGLALIVTTLFSPALSATPASKPQAARRTIDVEFGKDFRLELGMVARLPGRRAFLRIKDFINSPCPKGAQCGWSGLAVVHELTIDGKVVQAGPKGGPYELNVRESDYRSYAVFTVDEPERACARLVPGAREQCVRDLAVSSRSAKLCRTISEARMRGLCLEDLAGESQEAALCREVASPSQYCLYLRSKKSGDLAACDGIAIFRWRVRCVKEISKEGGGGPRSCSELEPDFGRRCRELAEGPDH